MSDTVKVDLPAAITHKGIAYGPGLGIEVPAAAAAKLPSAKAGAKAETKATKGGKK